MSRILGIYSRKKRIVKKEFEGMFKDFLAHSKGITNTKIKDKIFFCLTKSKIEDNLGIVYNEDQSKIILFGGNIYDLDDGISKLIRAGHKFKDRKNQAEFILHSYEEYGASFLKDLNGAFAFAIYDEIKDKLIVANDIFGLYPLFIHVSKKHIFFSTDFEPIIQHKDFSKKLDLNAIAEYFTLGFPVGNKTLFKGIKNLSPGTILKVEKYRISVKRYYNLNIRVNKNESIDRFADEAAKIIKKTTMNRVKGKKKMISSLTGGADTRLILSNLSKKQREDMLFYTDKRQGLDEDKDKDIIIAKEIAKELGLKHMIRRKKHKAKIEFDDSSFERARNLPDYARSLSGIYGGEFLGWDCFNASPVKINEISKKEIDVRMKEIFSKRFLRKINHPYKTLKKEIRSINAENKEFLFYIHQFTRGFLTYIYGGACISNMWGHPYRSCINDNSIYKDTSLLKFLLTIPMDYIKDYKLYNEIYRVHFHELIHIPTNSPLAKRKDSCIPKIKKGIEPKSIKVIKYGRSLTRYIQNKKTWKKKIYNKRYIKSNADNLNHRVIKQFVNFEAWCEKFY
jgi:hypothetical protein